MINIKVLSEKGLKTKIASVFVVYLSQNLIINYRIKLPCDCHVRFCGRTRNMRIRRLTGPFRQAMRSSFCHQSYLNKPCLLQWRFTTQFSFTFQWVYIMSFRVISIVCGCCKLSFSRQPTLSDLTDTKVNFHSQLLYISNIYWRAQILVKVYCINILHNG